MHTRWHKKDLCGQLLEKNPDDWEVLCLPALADADDNKYKHPKDPRKEGETLWPDFRHTQEQMEAMKNRISPRVWNALWQQSPSIKGGNMIKDAWLRFYDKLPLAGENGEKPQWISSWDFAFKGKKTSDYVAGLIIVKIGADYYVEDSYCDKSNFSESCDALLSMKQKHSKVRGHLIEDKANGPAIMNLLKNAVSGMIPINPSGGKEERVEGCIPSFIAGNIYINNNLKHLKTLLEQLTGFPNYPNDDLVDALTQGILWLDGRKNSVQKLRALNKWR